MIKTALWVIVLLSAVVYIAVVALLYFYQEKLIFPGTPLPQDTIFEYDLPFRELTLSVGDAELHALHFEQEDPKGLVFFLHGNGGNLQSWATGADYYRRVNYDLFIFDYRGYGKSTGRIESQEQIIRDVNSAWESIAPAYKGKPIVIYGRSLGSALAVQLAREVDHELLVLVSPFSSLEALAKEKYPLVPAWFLRYPFNTDESIADISGPIAIMHGDSDSLIGLEHAKRLQQKRPDNTRLYIIKDADHDDIHSFTQYLDALTQELP